MQILSFSQQARKLQATLVWNYDPATDWLTGGQKFEKVENEEN